MCRISAGRKELIPILWLNCAVCAFTLTRVCCCRLEATIKKQREATKDAILSARAAALQAKAEIIELEAGPSREMQRVAEKQAVELVRSAVKRKIGGRHIRAVVNDRREGKLRLLNDKVSRAIELALSSMEQQSAARVVSGSMSVQARANAVYSRRLGAR